MVDKSIIHQIEVIFEAGFGEQSMDEKLVSSTCLPKRSCAAKTSNLTLLSLL